LARRWEVKLSLVGHEGEKKNLHVALIAINLVSSFVCIIELSIR
jgi:hypothetical protein